MLTDSVFASYSSVCWWGSLESFDAIGLPAGQATGVPSRLSLPAGTSLKHIHGGPTYVYVLKRQPQDHRQ